MKTILYLPIDERFATRDTFLNLARLTPYQILTPPLKLLSYKKEPANLIELHKWVDENIEKADILILSAEMFLYGGLIASRISFDDYDVIEKYIYKLVDYKNNYPEKKIYLSTVIMRIPAYNLDVEEPHFWQHYGRAIYEYSYHTHRYEVFKEEKDLEIAEKINKEIPDKYLKEFLWRRERNHHITQKIIELQKEKKVFEKIYLTLDDNAPYGFNKKEEEILRKLINDLALEKDVYIYPGADEVGLTILAKAATDDTGINPTIKAIYRDEQGKNFIPNYEGQELAFSVETQIKAAGGISVIDEGELTIFINNFTEEKQLEARVQPENNLNEYSVFLPYIKNCHIRAFADVRYSNGGDRSFVEWIKSLALPIESLIYGAWNTCGNTLGTVIANSILLHLFNKKEDNAHFNILRLLEDWAYQADVRTDLMEYVQKAGESIFDLGVDINFYRRFVEKRLAAELARLNKIYHTGYRLKEVYFPWDRTFEVGLILENDN